MTNSDQYQTYLLVGPLEEAAISSDATGKYTAVLCVGDLLQFAPPPDGNPTGSLLWALDDDAPDLYSKSDVSAILEAIRTLPDHDDFQRQAKHRYRALLDVCDTPLYYIAGNQDVPALLTTVAETTEGIRHASDHDHVCAVDGAVPAFADFPPGTFPCECSADTFYRTIETSDAPILVAHTLPDKFNPAAYGFAAAVCATDNEGHISSSVARLPSFPRTGTIAELTLATGSRSAPAPITITRPDHTHVTPR